VLSVACGHLREVELSAAVCAGRVRLTAIDRDPESVSVAAREYGCLGVSAHVGTVRDIVRRKIGSDCYHFVYAAGLYDYLDANVGVALTKALFHLLAPAGLLMFANFTPRTLEAGYMEACMDWRLVYRDERQMEALLRGVPSREIACIDQFRDPDRNVTYLRVVRR
jgi:hypothetical protein